jgi:hypothetical protein
MVEVFFCKNQVHFKHLKESQKNKKDIKESGIKTSFKRE